ncbi:MAG: hypothetical protein VX278_15475 [Myxococcota bacterium]|nr:hypothetical protein [Myxococcota bacterium]
MLPSSFFEYFAQSISSSISSASRPALTFFIIQISVFFSAMYGYTAIVPQFAWLVAPVTICLAGILVVLEFISQHENDISTALDDIKVTPLINAFGAFSSALLFSSLGLPAEEAMQFIDGSADNQVTNLTQEAISSGQDTVTQVGMVVGSITANLTLTHYRAQLHQWLDDLEVLHIWQRLESGGVAAALIILLFSPILCLILLSMALLAGTILGLTIKKIQTHLDQRSRYECPHCAHNIRLEAIVCYACHNEVEPKRVLSAQEKKQSLIGVLTSKTPAQNTT